LPPQVIQEADAIVTTNEVTDRHGTGVILGRIFGQSPNVLSIRSTNLYREHSLGDARMCLGHQGLTRAESFARILHALNGSTVKRIVCVPFLPDELVTAIALKELFDAPLCTYVMDDNNIYSHGIADALMAEALRKSSLRLAISPEMREAYEKKYGLNFWVVPPVVNPAVVQTTPQIPNSRRLESRTGVLVGSLWSQRWLDRLRETVQTSGLQIDWFGNAQAPWLKVGNAELLRDGIVDCGFVSETELTERLKDYPYAIVPSGTLEQDDDRGEIARLSLPTRLPYLLAASNMPMVVLGSPATAAARFLQRFAVGRVCPYDGPRLRRTVEEICELPQQVVFRRQAACQSPLFSAEELAEWIWESLRLGEAADGRFERIFGRPESATAVDAETDLKPHAPQMARAW